jgi:hypothetical protein
MPRELKITKCNNFLVMLDDLRIKKCSVYEAFVCANNSTSRKVHLPFDVEVGKKVFVVVK